VVKNNLYHTFNCIVCGKEITYHCVGEPNKQSPCLKCKLKKLRKEED